MPIINHINNDSISFKFRKLISGLNSELQKRDSSDNVFFSDSSNAARYAFFAFVVAAFVVFILLVCVVNKRRIKSGRSPVISSYLAPPSYNQSQVAYEGQTTTNLPTYTPNPNANQDVGFYDKNGNFIPTSVQNVNDNSIELNDITLVDNNDNDNNTNNNNNSNRIPENAYIQNSSINDNQLASDMSYRRPDGPPPSRVYDNSNTIVGSSATADNDALPAYSPPETPIQSHYKS